MPAAADGPVMYKGVKGLGPPARRPSGNRRRRDVPRGDVSTAVVVSRAELGSQVREVDDPLGYDSYKSIFCKTFDETDAGLTIVASASHNTPETEAFIGKYKDCKKESKGSSLKLLMVAEGAAHVYPRLAPTSEWDTCAAHAIVECAGGEVLQHAGGKDCNPGASVEYNKPHPLNPFFVVYGKREVRKAVKKKDAISSAGGGPSPLVLGGVLAVAVVGYLFLA